MEECQRRLFAACEPHINNQLRALHLWSPDYVALASPLLTYALLGPAALHASRPPHLDATTSQGALRFLEDEILSFVLQRFARFWPVGNVVHRKYRHQAMHERRPPNIRLSQGCLN